jgi:parallel beta helix pectate lyase-like protein
MNNSRMIRFLFSAAILIGFSTAAFGQATRTWVSGVGDDANPCSRTAPCKTFAGAISKTASGGEINVLDPGGFGAVTITKPITISSECFEAGVLVSGTNGIVVNVPNAADAVVLRGLDFEGLGTGLSGITVLTGGTVEVEKCTINHFTVSGINFVTTVANTKLQVLDTIVRNNGNFGASSGQGVLVNPSAAANAELNNVRLENNVAGLKVQGNSKTSVSNCLAGNNAFAGFSAATSPAVLNIENSVSAHNATGINAVAGTNCRLGNNSITDNGAAVAGGGTVFSFKNNDFDVAATVTPINPQ